MGVNDRCELLGSAVTFATTEHFNLQTARALTVSEANGRASIYLEERQVGAWAAALVEDRPGFWEAAGYHNYGDPWKEQRYEGD